MSFYIHNLSLANGIQTRFSEPMVGDVFWFTLTDPIVYDPMHTHWVKMSNWDDKYELVRQDSGELSLPGTALVFMVFDGSRFQVIGTLEDLASYVPTSRTITAGDGLSGGGDLSANRTIDLDITDLTAETVSASGDQVAVYDLSAAAHRKMTLGNLLTGIGAQPLDATLTALAGLTTGADRLPYSTGTDTFSQATFTAFARTLLDDADATAARATLGITAYDAETVQDLVGAMVTDSTTIDATYSDAAGTVTLERAALTGDVTASAGSNATTIANNAVTMAKLADLATDRLIGRDTAGTGAPEALTVGGGIEFTGSGGIQTSALTGDVTKTAGGTATTIAALAVSTGKLADGAVTFAKMQDIDDDVVLGRATTGSGDVEEIACTAFARSILDDADAAAGRTTLGAAAAATTITAGTGLAGGGDLSASRTIDLDFTDLTAATTPASADLVAIYDDSAGAMRKMTYSNFTAGLDADTVDGQHASAFATSSHTHTLAAITDVTASASEVNILDGATLSTTELNYVDGVTSAIQTQLDAKAATATTITAGVGLAGGGSLAANRTIDLDITELTAETTIASDDLVAIYDTSAAAHRKMTYANFTSGLSTYTDEQAQDAIGGILVDSATIDFTYSDATPSITATVIQAGLDHGSIGGLADDDHTQYHNDSRALTWLGTRSTSDLPEGSNLYYTDERVDDRVAVLVQNGTGISWSYSDAGGTLTPTVSLAAFSTSNLSEGSNLYYTDERVDDRVAALIQNGTGITWSYSDAGGTLTPTVSLASFSTTNLSEGTNLYYTDERVDDRVSSLLTAGTGISLSYNDPANTLTIASTLSAPSALPVPLDEGGTGDDLSAAPEGLVIFSSDGVTEMSVLEAPTQGAGVGEIAAGYLGVVCKRYTNPSPDPMEWRTVQDLFSVSSTGLITLGVNGGTSQVAISVDLNKATSDNTPTSSEEIPYGSSTTWKRTTVAGLNAALDHGTFAGLGDDDHTQYHNDSRASTWLGTKSTTDLAEGSNLYYTDERVDDRVSSLLVAGTAIGLSYDDGANTLTVSVSDGVQTQLDAAVNLLSAGRLEYQSATQLRLNAWAGQYLDVGGEIQTVDGSTAGCQLAPTDNLINSSGADAGAAMGANTTYYVYRSNSTASFAASDLRASTTAPSNFRGDKYLATSGNGAKWRFVGMVRTNGSTQFTDNLLVVSWLNRRLRRVLSKDTTDSWSYTTGSWRGGNNGAAAWKIEFLSNGVDVVRGVTKGAISSTSGHARWALGLSSTSAPDADCFYSSGGANNGPMDAFYSGVPSIGYQYLQALEYGTTGATFYGDNGAVFVNGIFVEVMG